MQKISQAILETSLVWVNNILVELLSNHASRLGPSVQVPLREVVTKLSEAIDAVRRVRIEGNT